MRAGAAALLGMLVLSACGSDEGAGGPQSAAQRACDRQADDDPAVKELAIRSLGSQEEAYKLKFTLDQARLQARLRCLRAKGLAPPGGVEPVRPQQ
jgi:hypothetical protein